MSKIVVMGPLDLMMDTLSLIQELGIMQVEEDILAEHDERGIPEHVTHSDANSVLEHQFYTELRNKIGQLLHYLSASDVIGQPLLMPVESLASFLPVHLAQVVDRSRKIDALSSELSQLAAYRMFLNALGEIEYDNSRGDELMCIGARQVKSGDLALLKERLERDMEGKVAVEDVPEDDETVACVIMTEAELTERVCTIIDECGATAFLPPPGLEKLPYLEKRNAVDSQITEKKDELLSVQTAQDHFSRQWKGEYQRILEWINRRLSLISVTAWVVRTRMCFFIYGWLPASDFVTLDNELQRRFKGKVVLEESELVEQDFSRVPTALHNPAYFKPFELFTRLLPMPSYASFDLTPFIGIFFPIFFGMMLGDAGYGIILAVCAVFLARRYTHKKNIEDAGKILFISSLYTIFFGIMYGEFFGTLGHSYLNMKPIFFDRQTTVIPMFFFAMAAGVVHVILGLILGVMLSLRRKMKKEAVFKLVNIVFILGLCVLAISYFTPTLEDVRLPLLISLAITTPVLLLAGGLLAPLELLKNIGNIISYVRIMAVGLASVLLAYVANYMGGKIGSIWAGMFVALILHVFNMLLGVFAPTIHSLRLHYVEFLGKFMEPGGRKFTPLGKR